MTITCQDAAEFSGVSQHDAERIGIRVINALRAIETTSPGNVDDAGIAIRGGSVYYDTLDGRYRRRELAAARKALMLAGARMHLIECINAATILE